MNKVILMGRLARDPETRYSQGSEPMAVTRYTIAVDRRFKKSGEPEADFIPCVAFGKAGEFAEKYFKKGMQVCVSGRIQIRAWEDQQGQKRWSTDVILDDQEFAESKASFQSRQGSGQNMPQEPYGGGPNAAPEGFSAISESIDDDELPF